MGTCGHPLYYIASRPKQTDIGRTGAQERVCQVQSQVYHKDKIQGIEVPQPLVTDSASGYTKYYPTSLPRSPDRV